MGNLYMAYFDSLYSLVLNLVPHCHDAISPHVYNKDDEDRNTLQ